MEIDFPPLSLTGSRDASAFNALRFIGNVDVDCDLNERVALFFHFDPQYILVFGTHAVGGYFFMPLDVGAGLNLQVMRLTLDTGIPIVFAGAFPFPFGSLGFMSPFVGAGLEVPFGDNLDLHPAREGPNVPVQRLVLRLVHPGRDQGLARWPRLRVRWRGIPLLKPLPRPPRLDRVWPRSEVAMAVSRMSFPCPIVFGPGALQELPKELMRLGAKRPLLVADSGVTAAGLTRKVLDVLDKAQIRTAVWDGCTPNPTDVDVDKGLAAYKKDGCDSIVARGRRLAARLRQADSPAREPPAAALALRRRHRRRSVRDGERPADGGHPHDGWDGE